MCAAATSCQSFDGLFGQPSAAGVCEPTCDPLADNDFLHNGTKGPGCTATQGCYGYPGSSTPTTWACTNEVNSMIVHRSACTTANGCASSQGSPYLNGCAQGYEPLLYDTTGSMQVDCIALCKPADCYQGHCGTNSANLNGAAPHRCMPSDARGTFNVASATNNGDQCLYSWLFEIDSNGNHVVSPTSNTVGFCVDHSKYLYDSNNDGTPDTAWPRCDTFTSPTYGGMQLGAGDFGCVSTTTAGVPSAVTRGQPAALANSPRLPYGLHLTAH
jgi:hypothetical protein